MLGLGRRVVILWGFVACLGVAKSPRLEAFTLMSNGGHVAYWSNAASGIHFRFNNTSSTYFSGGQDHSGTSSNEFAPIRSAFNAWSGLSGLSLAFTEDSSNSNDPHSGDGANTIKWVRTGWTSLSFRPPTNALAVTLMTFDASTGRISDADVYFNAQNFMWAVVDSGSEAGYIDVQNIATHEIGHVIGLDHSSEYIGESDPDLADATMFYASSMGETSRRNPHTDDVNAVTALYGSVSRPTPSISSVELVTTNSDGQVFRIVGTNFNDNTEFILTRNDNSISDCVSRFRTIQSATQALVTFDVSMFVNGGATLLAFNAPTSFGTYSTEISGAGYAATSRGGSGGCSIEENVSALKGVVFALIGLIGAMSILSLRRQVKVRVRNRRS